MLPIAVRELRVSARNKATHRLRILFAIGAVTIAGGVALLSMISGGLVVSQIGIWIFGVLKWIAFALACTAGIFLTADSLSEEKREGTLGLLFLTDLRGHDVVLGKLLATSLRTFYSLLAIFPVMAFSFMLGGVAADDFWHSLVSLCNTLFFSLSLGMVVSVVGRDSHRTMTAACVIMVVFLFLAPEIDSLLLGRNANRPLISLLSPVFSFKNTDSYRAHDFWLSIIFVHLAGWCFLAIASWLVPKTWQEKGIRTSLGMKWPLPFSAYSREARRSLLEKSPVCWIISRDRWAANLARLAILLTLVIFALSLASVAQGPGIPTASPTMTATTSSSTTITSTNSTSSVTFSANWLGGMAANSLYLIATWCSGAMSYALVFWLAAHVCRFYVDGQRTGFFELLLVTPIKPPEILHGHWLALRRLFLAPVAAQLFLTLSCGAIQVWVSASNQPQELFMLVLGVVNWGLGLFTVVWFSIWMGVTSKKINIAMLKTISYAKVLPWIGFSFLGGFLFMLVMFHGGGARSGIVGMWFAPIMFQLIFTAGNIALIAFAQRHAKTAFTRWVETAGA